MEKAVAIIGMGAQFPGAPDLAAFRRLVREAATAVAPVPSERWDHRLFHSANPRHANRTPARCGSFMEGIDAFAPEHFGITPKRARIMDPQQRLMLEVSRQAIEDSGYAARPLAGGRVGVYVGASSSDHRGIVGAPVEQAAGLGGRFGSAPPLSAEQAEAVTRAVPPIQAYTIVGQQLNMIAANVSQAFGFTGPAFAVDTACSSALAALHEAVHHLRSGLVDAAVVGGVYVQLDPVMMVCFSKVGALSPTDRCRPFQAGADGFVLGEGVGAVVLKRLSQAEADGDRIVAVVRGVAMNNDGRAHGPVTPSAAGQEAVIRQAWEDSGVDPATVGLIEAHGTATPAGDEAELSALKAVFGPCVTGRVPITSVKANIGHGLSSAGIASLIKACLAIDGGFLPPQPVVGPLVGAVSSEGGWLRVPLAAEPWPREPGAIRRAGVSAFGFGGTNVHVVLEEAPVPSPAGRPGAGPPLRFDFSAPSAELLAHYLLRTREELLGRSLDPADVSYTLSLRKPAPVGISLAADGAGLADHLQRAAASVLSGELPLASTGEVARGRLVFLPPSPVAKRSLWAVDRSKLSGSGARALPSESPEACTEEGDRIRAVSDAVATVTGRSPSDVHPDMRLAGDLGFDSLTTLEFISVLGRAFPGLRGPPRALFTPDLTVGGVADYLATAEACAATPPGGAAVTFDAALHPWLPEHRPGGRPLLPLSAIVEAVRSAIGGASPAHVILDFRVHLPVDVGSGSVTLLVDRAGADGFTVRSQQSSAVVASGRVAAGVGPGDALPAPEVLPGSIGLEHFYGEFGFHGPGLRALAETPRVGPAGALGAVATSGGAVFALDGALQLALYWLASQRQRTAVATGFDRLSVFGEWPAQGLLRCVATLADEGQATVIGDFDFFSASGACVAQWRGVSATLTEGSYSSQASGPAGWPEVRALASRKAALAASGLQMPYFRTNEGRADATTRIGGRELVNFSAYNYLGLAGDPDVCRASAEAIGLLGTSSSASRLASGERPIHAELESAIARFLGCEDALVLVSGHATNVSLIGHLFGPEDLIVHDSLAHDSILAGARLSGARRLAFAHNDMGALEALLARERPRARRALVAIEGAYSMDGDVPDLARAVALKNRFDALLLVDEAHSLGVLGATGRGIAELKGVPREDVELWMGTLSKALASSGGYIAGSAAVIDYLRFTLPGFVYSVGLAPANAAAALEALRILEARPELPRLVQKRSDFFRTRCLEQGVDVGLSAHSAIVPCIVGASDRAVRLAQALTERGINVQPIFFPAVEEGRARLRFFITALHTEEQLAGAAAVLGEELAASESANRDAAV